MGGLSGLGFAPYFAFPVAYFGVCAQAFLIRHSPNVWAAFVVGWAFGFGQFIVGLSWINESFAVEAERFGVLAWPAVATLSAFLAMFPALAAMATRYLGGPGPAALVIFPAAWCMAEMGRGAVLTGFPWNLIGYIWGFSDEVLQTTSAVGIYGLGLLTVLLATMPILIIERFRFGSLSTVLVLILAPVIGFVVLWAGGALRLAAADAPANGQRLRLVQPNIPQNQKWEPNQANGILDKLLALSTSGGGDRPRYVVWPETAYPLLFELGRNMPAALVASVPPGGLLLFGAVREAPERRSKDAALLNSLLVINDRGQLVADYDKVRLVPFGEFTPFKNVLGAMKMTVGDIDYIPGNSSAPVSFDGLPAARVLICYEAIFPRAREGDERWILNITNDAWFGLSAGPYQHFLAAKVRAIEAGLPLLRAANSGVSAIVDSYGRVDGMLPLNVSGVIDGRLPAPAPAGTLFGRFGHVPVLVVAALLVTAGTFGRRRPPTS
ncbi:apolipoprotein N-acyltransferase [Pseudaminobacter sp. 19-2017]|uniref:Apolipoprotein N-acyltransferase n=1 Tax=Pseudaminobacter soli (ex Zhang et al. 2022) TaxID=2831468 RepID=A0A942E5Z8_9HYPH|nr:apolipoprotein N-acyltransferase [Pseudaminobacter soli]